MAFRSKHDTQRISIMELRTLHEMYIAELQEIASVERQIFEFLGRGAKFALHPCLKNVLADMRGETEAQSLRVETLLEQHGANPQGHLDQTMQAMVYEMERTLPMLKGDDLRDAGMIASLQRLKHYEIAVYGTLATLARQLELVNDEKALRQNLDEEKQADASLTELAQSEVNPDAIAV
jgi:ferritin-like metal-binding protein YciE